MSMLKAPTPRLLRHAVLGVLLAAAMALAAPQAHAQTMDRTGTQWSPYLEWSLENPSFSGNPFDLVATAHFVHSASGETRTTEMFYNGGNEWKFRFTGTRTGEWTFTTASSDADLAGHAGTVTINENPNPDVKGFITSQGNKFARQTADGSLEAWLFNVYMNDVSFPFHLNLSGYQDPSAIQGYLDAAEDNGFSTVYFALNNNWLSLGANAYNEHSSVNPDLATFGIMDSVITAAHQRGMSMHFWAWGDEARRWTPIGLTGGINGAVDRRLQRYIAARLGPLPGWTMGYGFDLQEWVSEAQAGSWAQYMHDHMGWDHMLWARGRSHPALSAIAYSGFDNFGYNDARSRLNSDTSRPHAYTERFLYNRRTYWDMQGTRQKLWQYVMAGGMGSWWGVASWANPGPYPSPAQLRTHSEFWSDRYTLDLAPAAISANALALRSSNGERFVLYQEGTSTITADLTGLTQSQEAVAVDTTGTYQEISLGTVSPGTFTWNAPKNSDWVIAIGGNATSPTPALQPPPAPAGESLNASQP